MKLLAAIALATIASTATASQCHSGQMSFEELRYSDEPELINAYCRIGRILEISEPGKYATIQDRRDYADRLGACADYRGQISKVLRKEFNTDSNDLTCK